MEFFNTSDTVKLKSHLDKYLIADEDQETVRQSRNGSSRKSKWQIELITEKNHAIRLKSCYGRYLTASDIPFLLGMTGKKVIQSAAESQSDLKFDWEPIRDGFQVKLRSWCGKYLRGNGGTPPWRNSVTHDEPLSGSTMNWILWTVETAEITEAESVADYMSCLSSNSSVGDEFSGSESGSPMSVVSMKNPRLSFVSRMSSRLSPNQSLRSISPANSNKFRNGMDLFHNAKAVRLKSHHGKYLLAEEDEESVTQDRNGSSKNARWTVEFKSESDPIIRLKSCYSKYLTASNQPFLLGMTGRKVTQTYMKKPDSSVEWEPIREGNQMKLKTRYGNFLRANGGVPPWRNSVTHDVPHRTVTQDWVLWDVDIVEIEVKSPTAAAAVTVADKRTIPAVIHSESMASSDSSSPSTPRMKSGTFSRQESSDGRTVYYHIADENGDVEDENLEGYTFTFKGSGVDELTRKLEEETGLDNIIVCSRSPLTNKLYPLRLQLPPNNATMHVVLVESTSKVAREFTK